MTIDEKLFLFSELTPEERREVEAFVAAHPAWEEQLEAAQAWAALLGEAREMAHPEPTDTALAYYVATRRLQQQPAPPALQRVFARLEAMMADDPALRQRCEALAQRLQRLEAGRDVVGHFERLTGHTLPARPRQAEADPSAHRPVRRDRAPRSPVRLYQLTRTLGRVAAGLCILVVGYGALFLISEVTTSDLTRAAYSDMEALRVFGPRLRGNPIVSSETRADSLYLLALEEMKESRRTFLGLFPRYDEGLLRQAEAHLRTVTTLVPADSYVSLEAQYYLGKLYLARGDTVAAVAAFRRVVEGGGSETTAARALLEKLQTDPDS